MCEMINGIFFHVLQLLVRSGVSDTSLVTVDVLRLSFVNLIS